MANKLALYIKFEKICVITEGMYKVHHQNPDKSNNFFKQNVFNEKLNIIKNPFTWHLRDNCALSVEHNYSIYPPLA